MLHPKSISNWPDIVRSAFLFLHPSSDMAVRQMQEDWTQCAPPVIADTPNSRDFSMIIHYSLVGVPGSW